VCIFEIYSRFALQKEQGTFIKASIATGTIIPPSVLYSLGQNQFNKSYHPTLHTKLYAKMSHKGGEMIYKLSLNQYNENHNIKYTVSTNKQ